MTKNKLQQNRIHEKGDLKLIKFKGFDPFYSNSGYLGRDPEEYD